MGCLSAIDFPECPAEIQSQVTYLAAGRRSNNSALSHLYLATVHPKTEFAYKRPLSITWRFDGTNNLALSHLYLATVHPKTETLMHYLEV